LDKPAALDELIQALRCLPGVGPKSAQRMAYHLLQRDPKGAERLARGLSDALGRIRHCARCNTFTEAELCAVCSSPRRDAALLCVVESPGDLFMMEQTQSYSGLYFVLMGRLSPLDGIGPREIHLDRRLSDKRLFPAIDLQRSGTRKEELLIPKDDLARIWVMRRVLNPLSPTEQMEVVLERLEKTKSNAEFLASMQT